MAKVSRLLVIDASVLRGAGEKAGHSAHCTQVLSTILEICHRAVFCSEIQTEWNKHQSRMAVKWRAAMNARKKLIRIDIQTHTKRIAARVDDLLQATAAQKAALEKDVHLLAAAAHSANVIVTGDDALRELCDLHLDEGIEWLLVLPEEAVLVRQITIDRLFELSNTRAGSR